MSDRIYFGRLQEKLRRALSTFCARHRVRSKQHRAMVSFSFDDFPASALQVGAPILEKYGVRGTFYASLGLKGGIGPVGQYFSEPDIAELLSRGHELGCHTYDHCNAWYTPPDTYEQSVVRNRDNLKGMLPEACFTSHSYPISYPKPANKSISERYFSCARGGGQRPNKKVTDANNLAAFFVEKSRNDFLTIKSLIDSTAATASWLIFATHDVSSAPSPFGCSPAFFELIVRYTVESGAAVLPVARAFTQFRA